jgi:FkbM family methyltransferase
MQRLLPDRHLPYPVRGGWVYLSLGNAPTSLQRVLRTYEPLKFANIATFLPRGGCFVDVGANAGDFSVWATRCGGPGTQVLAIEAEPENARWLRRTVTRTGLDAQIRVENVAASAGEGETELLLTAKHGTHSIVENELHRKVEAFRPVQRITVPTRTLDALIADAGLPTVDVVKIDVEGAEELVLAGASGLLSQTGPLTLLIDLHFGVDVPGLAKQLQSHGFTLRREDEPHVVIDEVPPKTLSIVAVR